MTLDSIGRAPLLISCPPDSYWTHPELNSFLSAAYSPPCGSFVSRTPRKYNKSRKMTYPSRVSGQGHGREGANESFERETKQRNFSQESYPLLPLEKQVVDHDIITAVTAKDYQMIPWATVAYSSNDHLQSIRQQHHMLGMPTRDNTGLDPDRGDLSTFYRERAQSTGSWRSFGMNQVPRTSSFSSGKLSTAEDSLSGRISSSDDSVSERTERSVTDASLESMRRNLLNLWTSKGEELHHPWTLNIKDEFTRSSSFSAGSSSLRWCNRTDPDVHPMNQVRQRYSDLPADATSRKRKSKTIIDKPCGKTASTTTSNQDYKLEEMGPSSSDDFPEPSILRSMLTERGRCYSMSVIEMRRRRLADRPGGLSTDVNSSATALSQTTGSQSDKQLVTLAKKNLLPVTARITDLLNKIVDFAKSLPDFVDLPRADQETLLLSSCLRLLLLVMAETNLQFATTVINADVVAASAGGECYSSHHVDPKSSRDPDVSKAATAQFVDSIQNFIRKCQRLDITGEEYHQMKIITLFHSGIGSMSCTRVANSINSRSRQQLQDLTSRCHSNEKLRYSSLLLSLHTLYGVHSGMMRSLFCRHLDKSGGIRTFIDQALSVPSTL